jgi:hypothetical protein
VLAVAIAGCGSSSAPRVIVVTATSAPAATEVMPTAVPTAGASAGNFTDNQTQMQAVILKTSIDAQGSQYIHPKPGHVWQLLDVQIANHDANAHDYNPYDFNAVDQAGQTYQPDALLIDRPTLDSGSLPPGEKRAGWMGFEIPRTTKTLTITWSDSVALSPPAEIAHYRLH